MHAFETLIEAHIPRVRRFARSFTHATADADDLAQEALLKVYRSLHSYRFESSFSTWLYRVMKNAFMDAFRHGETLNRATKIAGEELVAPTQAPRPDEQLLAAEERARLWAAIGAVSPDFRTALVLCDVEDMSISEVAAIEKLPEGTIKSRLHRGRAQLARLLQDKVAGGNPPNGASVKPSRGGDRP